MTIKLKPKIKKEWVAALRSGKYKQGKGQLYCSNRDAYCCLGVLCDIVAKKENSTIDSFTWKNKDVVLGLPNVCLKEFVSAKPLTKKEKEYSASGWEITEKNLSYNSTLDRLNDDNYTFDQIADIIEEQF